MLSYFPARDVEEPATKAFVQSETALVRIELHEETAAVRADIAAARSETAALRTEMHDGLATVQAQTQKALRDQLIWLTGVIVASSGTIIALLH